jgi:hypothetical protein
MVIAAARSSHEESSAYAGDWAWTPPLARVPHVHASEAMEFAFCSKTGSAT